MGKILQAFADGELYVTEIVQKRTPERQKLIEKNLQLYNELNEKLNDDEQKLLQNLLDVISDENYYDTQNNFIRGYCLGALMTMEILSEQSSFLQP
ncbi:DUF6809 family protein [Clostridium sp. MD294]|uniref:DUF6809 family protein n=1 Tax=Clostridium sp. MD294 TaxID=97138 RepID=UPI0002CC9227|nr:DUF6809 family protein [Clostridium sp. MD294]NDO47179.1 hypothetical protein [Clostridium sp. MD294]USF29758.1 hypothetical protein C820_001166 [Clostridium sp. MD294]